MLVTIKFIALPKIGGLDLDLERYCTTLLGGVKRAG